MRHIASWCVASVFHRLYEVSKSRRTEQNRREYQRWTCTYPYIGPGLCDCVCCGSPSRWGFPAPVPGAGGHPSLCAGFMLVVVYALANRDNCRRLRLALIGSQPLATSCESCGSGKGWTKLETTLGDALVVASPRAVTGQSRTASCSSQ